MIDFTLIRAAFRARDSVSLRRELLRQYPEDPDAGAVDALVAFALGRGAPPEVADASSKAYLESIARAGLAGQTAARNQDRSLRVIGTELDFLGDLGGLEAWTIAQVLNRLVMSNLPASQRAAVVGTMRNDGIYIMEWVAHYRALGFEHLFVYTNDNTDDSLQLLGLLARHGVLTVIENDISGGALPEVKAYGHALGLLQELRDFEWALFVDSDEFLIPSDRYGHSVQGVLDAIDRTFPNRDVAGVCFDWLWFISDMVFERRPGLLCERFQNARPHWLAKCLVRVRDVMSMRLQHFPELEPGLLVVDSNLKVLDPATIWERRVAEYAGGRINHYWPRSFEEFAVKKARGAALAIPDNPYDRPYELFFKWNGYSAPENHFPTPPDLLRRVREQIQVLRDLEGVAEIADRIDRDFEKLLARAAPEAQLREQYYRNASEPGEMV